MWHSLADLLCDYPICRCWLSTNGLLTTSNPYSHNVPVPTLLLSTTCRKQLSHIVSADSVPEVLLHGVLVEAK